jgi:serine/threonine-protein kinase ATR
LQIADHFKILKLAKTKMSNEAVQVEKLFSPFWDTIAVNAVKDLLIRPQTAQLMSDLMEISVPDLLVLTQSHTLPWLVMHKKTDIIKRISQARKDNDDLEICITQNLVPILAILMVQNVPTTEAYIMQTLRAISPGFKEFDVSDLLRTEPANLALCLLRAAAEADDAHKSRVCIPCALWIQPLMIPRSDWP